MRFAVSFHVAFSGELIVEAQDEDDALVVFQSKDYFDLLQVTPRVVEDIRSIKPLDDQPPAS